MINNPMMRRITDNMAQLMTDVQQLEKALDRKNDLIGQLFADGVLTLDEAADVRQVCRATMRKECEKADARNESIGITLWGRWIIGVTPLLDLIERTDGRHARLIAEDRVKKYSSRTLR